MYWAKKFHLQNDLAYWGYDRSYARGLVIVLATGVSAKLIAFVTDEFIFAIVAGLLKLAIH